MFPVPHPEVLASDFVPPVAIGRRAEVARLLDLLGEPRGAPAPPRVVEVVGPEGSGSSVVARIAARTLLEGLRGAGGAAPRLAGVRVRRCRGSLGVAAALVQTFDEGFDGHGFPAAEVLAGFFRRLRREGRPAVVVLDDIGPSAPDLSVLFRGFVRPDRFLPEGESGVPPVWVLLAGVPEAVATWASARRAGLPEGRRVLLAPYDEETVRAIVRDRLARAFGRPAPPELAEEIARRSLAGGPSANRALEVLRRAVLGSRVGVPVATPGPAGDRLSLEPRVLEALQRALAEGPAALGALRRWEARLAGIDGERPLPATTLWRRILRLEAEGLIRRQVRMGGEGGTRSMVELVRPFTEWPVRPPPRGTRPAAGPVASAERDGGPARWAAAGRPTPGGLSLPSGDGPR